MIIREMFEKDIDRNINGVIQVAQSDEATIRQELEEYIVTRELYSHFNTFVERYENSIDTPTDKIGVWISGFFGSGKSHFLKMLSYILSNKRAGGIPSVDYFRDKFTAYRDEMMFSRLERCAKLQNDTILFNIDSKGPVSKDKTAILRVFANVFYDYLGYYGGSLKVARLEQFIDRQGKTAEFRRKFEEINGSPWTGARSAYAFWEDDIVAALIDTLGMSEIAARNWFGGTDSPDINIDMLTDEIRDYVMGKGKNFRLLFMIDEIGQYIGADSDLMLNLQTIVELLGSKCAGRVWVMVTSQEAIDSLTKRKEDDFSKIQGRFNTRLSLSSSSVDEVIKKRILAKNENAADLLKLTYAENSAVLRNLFTFTGSVTDIKGFTSEREFGETYPFVPYQFIVMQKVLAEIRKHGNAGRHLSGGERSMLSGFQEAAQAVKHRDEHALVPFWLFYDTIITFLDSPIRRVIERCRTAAENRDGIEMQDVNVLKLLYLIRYIDDIRANIDNIAVLMTDDMRADKIALKAGIAGSLDRLHSQNYISRSGDTYTFLTDDEQEIAREIRNTAVDGAMIVGSIAAIIFGEIYPQKKFRYGRYDFAFDQMVDDTVYGTVTGAVKLRAVTLMSELAAGGDPPLIMKSQLGNEAIVVLSDDSPYYAEIESAMKIRNYVKRRNVAQMPEAIQAIIRSKQQEATALEARCKSFIEQAIVKGVFYVAGEKIGIKGSTASERLSQAMASLIESVYTKLGLVRKNCESDAELLEILNGSTGQPAQQTLNGITAPNAEALRELDQYLEIQNAKHISVSMGEIQNRFGGIPYGWREIDIAALTAELIAAQRITVRYAGNTVLPSDRKMPDYLRRKSDTDKTVISRRIAVSDRLIRETKDFLREYLNVMDIPPDEDGLVRFITDRITEKAEYHRNLLDSEYASGCYPDRQTTAGGLALLEDVLSQKRDNTALLNRLSQKRAELLDLEEDMADVKTFFKNQKEIFDKAVKLLESLTAERDYLNNEDEAKTLAAEIGEIVSDPKPYKKISALPSLMQKLQDIYRNLLTAKKEEVAGIIVRIMGDIHTAADGDPKAVGIIRRADDFLTEKKEEAASSSALTALDAMITRVVAYGGQTCREIEVITAPDPGGKNPVLTVRRYDVFPVKRLTTEAEIDAYAETVKSSLKELLKNSGGLQLS